MLGNYRAPLISAEIEGELSHPFEETLFDLDGSATYLIDGKHVEAVARGSVFLDESQRLKGLMLTIEDVDFGQRGLSLVTLDEQGRLDTSAAQAFAYTSREFKMSHPMQMNCETSPYVEKAPLDWLPF